MTSPCPLNFLIDVEDAACHFSITNETKGQDNATVMISSVPEPLNSMQSLTSPPSNSTGKFCYQM